MSNHKFTMGSLFDGSGGFPLGAQLSGIEPVWASEVEPYPIAVTRHHFPNMKHLGDVSNIHGGEIDPVDVVTFGSPCFPAGTMIDTDKGRVPIEKVTVGMRVLTHMGRYRPVLAIGSKMSDTIILRDEFGGTLECTRNHPIYSAKKVMYNGVNVIVDIGVWIQAQDMLGLLWSRPVAPKDKFNNLYLFVNVWQKVVSISVGRENIQVYNMTVAIDNSYIADGIVVHNCQDMSVAGKRAGLLHTSKGDETTTRSGLFYEAIRIIREMRESTHGKYPSFAVWENVPGALTSAKGEDFRCVLQELLQIAEGGELSVPRPANGKWLHAGEILADHCSIAWRILDAQYWGVPQRRKRIYLVADFGGQRAGEILFERESMRGDSAEGGEAREGTADNAAGGVGGSGREGTGFDGYNGDLSGDVSSTLGVNCGVSTSRNGVIVRGNGRGLDAVKCYDIGEARLITPSEYTEKSPTLTARCGTGGNNVPEVVYQNTGVGWWNEGRVAETLRTPCGGDSTKANIVIHDLRGNDDGYAVYPEIARTLAARHDSSPCADRGQNVVALDCRNLVGNQEISGTLQSKDEGGYNLNYVNPVVYNCRVIPLNEQVIMRHNKLGKGTGFGAGNIGDHAFTLQASHPHMIACDAQAVVYSSGSYGALSEGVGCIGTGARATAEMVAVYDCAKPPRKYIVRRLTPLECNRLQGFPDSWGFIPHKDAMTDEEYQFWTNVRNTHIAITGKSPKSFTKKSIINWYNKLHTDSAEYKMWGNGICLFCAIYCMQGIAKALDKENNDEEAEI